MPVSGQMSQHEVRMSRNSGADVLAKLAARSSMNAAGPPVEVQSEAFLSRVNSPPHGPEATSNDTVGYAVRHGYGSLGMQAGTIDEDSDVDGWVSPLSRAAVSRTSDVLSAGCANDSFMARVSSPPTGPDATSNATVAFSMRHRFPCLAQTLAVPWAWLAGRNDSL